MCPRPQSPPTNYPSAPLYPQPRSRSALVSPLSRFPRIYLVLKYSLCIWSPDTERIFWTLGPSWINSNSSRSREDSENSQLNDGEKSNYRMGNSCHLSLSGPLRCNSTRGEIWGPGPGWRFTQRHELSSDRGSSRILPNGKKRGRGLGRRARRGLAGSERAPRETGPRRDGLGRRRARDERQPRVPRGLPRTLPRPALTFSPLKSLSAK